VSHLRTARLLLVGTTLSCALPAWAVTGTDEFGVNTHTELSQNDPRVASSGVGFVVVWESAGQDGSEPAELGVFGQRYLPAGVPLGTEFRINAYTTGDQGEPVVAMDGDGDFVVVWRDQEQGKAYSQAFEFGGDEKTAEVLLSATLADFGNPRIAFEPGIGYLIVFEDSDDSGPGISAILLQPDGVPSSGGFPINTYTTGAQELPEVAGIGGGLFLVTWQSDAIDGDAEGIRAARIQINGHTDTGVEFTVNSHTTGGQKRPRAAGLADGGFVVAWDGERTDGDGSDIVARVFDGSADPVGTDVAVNTYTTAIQADAAVSGTPDGGFVVSWSSFDAIGTDYQDGSGIGVFGRRFEATVAPASTEFGVNVHTTADQSSSTVGALGSGFVVVWQSGDQDGDDDGVFGRMFDTSTTTTLATTTTTLDVTTTTLATTTTTLAGSTTTTLATTTTTSGETTTTLPGTTTTLDTTTTLPVTTTSLGGTTTTIVGQTTTTVAGQTTTTLATTSTTLGGTTTTGPSTTTTAPVTTTSTLPLAACGDPIALVADAASSDRAVLASDALFILKTAVGTEECLTCVCDTSGDLQVTASDALIALRVAVGAPQSLSCPPC
jgi:hypothetical protein